MEMFTIRIASSLLSRSTKVHCLCSEWTCFTAVVTYLPAQATPSCFRRTLVPRNPEEPYLSSARHIPGDPFQESRDASTRGEATLRPARLRRTYKGLTVHSQLIPSAAHDQIEPCAYEKKPQRHDTIEIKIATPTRPSAGGGRQRDRWLACARDAWNEVLLHDALHSRSLDCPHDFTP